MTNGVISCPNCGQRLKVRAEAAGRAVRCARCGHTFTAPQAPPASACPACGMLMPDDAVVCMDCGTNRHTGERLDTSVASATPTEGKPLREPWLRLVLQLVGDLFPGLLMPWVLIFSIIVTTVGLGVMGFAIFLFILGAVFTSAMAGGVGLIIYAHAAAFILTGQLSFLSDTLSELSGNKWLLFFLWVFAPIVAFLVSLNWLEAMMTTPTT